VLKPTYAISLGSLTLSADSLGPLRSLRVERVKNGGADWAVVSLGRTAPVSVAAGDDATIALGWDGDTTTVFTGEVESVAAGIAGTEVSCAGGQIKLVRSRSSQTFVDQPAGQVVSALASAAGLDTDTVEDGIDLPSYAVDTARHSYEHCLGLARRCGFDLYTTEAGALVFAPFTAGAPDQRFRFGAEVIAVSVDRLAAGDGVSVVPESPASGQGDDTSSWLVKDPSSYVGEAGGTATLVVSDPLLRTQEAAASAASGMVGFRQRDVVSGRLELLGRPGLGLGGAVEIADLPDDSSNDTYQVVALRHVLDRRRGFRTMVGLGGMGAAGL
jgi:phage protein D